MNLDHISALSPSTGRTWRIGVCAAFLVLLTAAATVRAEQPYLIQNLPGRTTTSLGGHWDAIVDPYGTGYGSRFYESARPRDKADRVEYDFDTSDQLFVPGDWNSQRDNLFFYEGTVWYRRVFDYRPRPGTRLFVSFGAANYAARVWLNGEELGRHEGGYTPFVFEVTGKIRETGNFLVVAVEDTRKVDRVPTLSTDWWNYGGLTREVLLVETPSVFVRDYVVQLEKGSRDRIAGWVQVDGTKAPATVTVRIPEAKLEHRVTTDAAGHAVFAFDAPGLALWSPESPKLYDVEIATDSGTVRDEIGFRSIETRGADILLNGKPVFLRGICIHAEAPTRPGRAWSRDDARTLLGWAKDLGCNFVRLAHYPHDENMVREADRMGLLVWSEVPVYWAIAWEDQNALASAHQQLEEMIARDHNRASIILWSIGNETPSSDARLRFMRSLADSAHALDPTRLVTAAIFSSRVDTRTQRLEDPLGASLDVLGCNEYIGWYERTPEDADIVTWSSVYDKPLVMSEFGGGALYGNHGDAGTRWTEEYQARLYEHQIKMLDRIPFLRGMTPWILKDFRSPNRLLPRVQDFWNRKGLVSDRGQRKMAFYVLQHYYAEKARGALR